MAEIFIDSLVFLLCGIGAFLCWAAKGFKTRFRDELPGRNVGDVVKLFKCLDSPCQF